MFVAKDKVSQACLSCHSATSQSFPVSYIHREISSAEFYHIYRLILGTVHSSLDYCRVPVDSAEREILCVRLL